MPFTCTICEEESTRICVACTKDTCGNHLCQKCRRCSDCCDCEVRLDVSEDAPPAPHIVMNEVHGAPVEVHGALAETPREPQPHPHPMPDPDPAPEPDPMPIPGFPQPEE